MPQKMTERVGRDDLPQTGAVREVFFVVAGSQQAEREKGRTLIFPIIIIMKIMIFLLLRVA